MSYEGSLLRITFSNAAAYAQLIRLARLSGSAISAPSSASDIICTYESTCNEAVGEVWSAEVGFLRLRFQHLDQHTREVVRKQMVEHGRPVVKRHVLACRKQMVEHGRQVIAVGRRHSSSAPTITRKQVRQVATLASQCLLLIFAKGSGVTGSGAFWRIASRA